MTTTFFIGQIIAIVSLSALLIFALAKLVSRQGCSHVSDGYGHAVLITGCDSGFGYQLARCLDHKGFVVFAGCLFPEGVGAQSLARQSSSNLKILKLDVTNDEDIQQAKKIVQESLPEKGERSAAVKKHDPMFLAFSFKKYGSKKVNILLLNVVVKQFSCLFFIYRNFKIWFVNVVVCILVS